MATENELIHVNDNEEGGQKNKLEPKRDQPLPGGDAATQQKISNEIQAEQIQNSQKGNPPIGQTQPRQEKLQDQNGKTQNATVEGDRAYVPDGKGGHKEFTKTVDENGKSAFSLTEKGKTEYLYPRENKSTEKPALDTEKKSENKSASTSDQVAPIHRSEPGSSQPEKQKSNIEQQTAPVTENKRQNPETSKDGSKSDIGPASLNKENPSSPKTSQNESDKRSENGERVAELNRIRQEQESQSNQQKLANKADANNQTEHQASKSGEQQMNRQSVSAGDQARDKDAAPMSMKNLMQDEKIARIFQSENSINELQAKHANAIKEFAASADRKDVIDQTSASTSKVVPDRGDVNEQSSIGKQNHNSGDGKGGIPIPAKVGGGGGGGSAPPEAGTGKGPMAKPGEPVKGGDGVGGGGRRGEQDTKPGRDERDIKGEHAGKNDRGEKGEQVKDGKNDREPHKADAGKSEGKPEGKPEGKADKGDRRDVDDKGKGPDKGDHGGKIETPVKQNRPEREPGKGEREPGKGNRDDKKGEKPEPGTKKGERSDREPGISGKFDPRGDRTSRDPKDDRGDKAPQSKGKGMEPRYQLDQILLAKIQNFSKQPLESRTVLADLLNKVIDKNSGKGERDSAPTMKEAQVTRLVQDLHFSNAQLKDLRNYILDPKGRPFEFTKFDQKTQLKIAEVLSAVSSLSRDGINSTNKADLKQLPNATSKAKIEAFPTVDQTKTVIQSFNRELENRPGTKLTDTLTRAIGKADQDTAPTDLKITSTQFVNELISRLRDREILPFQREIAQKQEQKQILTRINEIRENVNGPTKQPSSDFESIKSEQENTVISVDISLNSLDAVTRLKRQKQVEERAEKERDSIPEPERTKSNQRTRQRYVVQPGDTLSSIAKAFLDEEKHAIVIFHNNRDNSSGKNDSNKNDSNKNYKIPLREIDGHVCAVPIIGSSLMIPNRKRVEDYYKLPSATTCYEHINFFVEAEPAKENGVLTTPQYRN